MPACPPAQRRSCYPLFAVVGPAPLRLSGCARGAGQPLGFQGGWRSEYQAGWLCQKPSRGPCEEETASPFWFLSHWVWMCVRRRQVDGCSGAGGLWARIPAVQTGQSVHPRVRVEFQRSLCLSASKAAWVCTHSRCFPTLMDGGLWTCAISGVRKSKKM